MRILNMKENKLNQILTCNLKTDRIKDIFLEREYEIKKIQAEQEEFLDGAAVRIMPLGHSLAQMEHYLKKKYRAQPYEMTRREMETLKAEVIMKHYIHVLYEQDPLKDNSTEGENPIFDQDVFQQIRSIPPEKLNLQMKAYRFSRPQEFTSRVRPFCKKRQGKRDEVIVQMEMQSEYLGILNGTDRIVDDLIFYHGVFQNDILERNARFVTYAYMMRRTGRL